MEKRIIEASENLLMAINDIKDYQDFINYKPAIIKAINDIKNSIKIYLDSEKEENINQKSKISSILGLQFDYDSLIDENDIKFLSDYEEKNNKIKNKINSYFNNNNYKWLNENQNNLNLRTIKTKNSKNISYNYDKTLNYTEDARNRNKIYHIFSNDKNTKNKNKNKKQEILIRKKIGKKVLIENIIRKLNQKDYIYDILTNLYGNDIKEKLFYDENNDNFIEEVQNSINEIEKLYKKTKNNDNINLGKKIEKIYINNFESLKNKNRKTEINIKKNMINNLNEKIKKFKRYKSFNKLKYSQQYEEFKNGSKKKNLKYYYNNVINTNCNDENKNNIKNNEIKYNNKRKNSSFKISFNQKPFISATCGYGKYFDESLQKVGYSKL